MCSLILIRQAASLLYFLNSSIVSSRVALSISLKLAMPSSLIYRLRQVWQYSNAWIQALQPSLILMLLVHDTMSTIPIFQIDSSTNYRYSLRIGPFLSSQFLLLEMHRLRNYSQSLVRYSWLQNSKASLDSFNRSSSRWYQATSLPIWNCWKTQSNSLEFLRRSLMISLFLDFFRKTKFDSSLLLQFLLVAQSFSSLLQMTLPPILDKKASESTSANSTKIAEQISEHTACIFTQSSTLPNEVSITMNFRTQEQKFMLAVMFVSRIISDPYTTIGYLLLQEIITSIYAVDQRPLLAIHRNQEDLPIAVLLQHCCPQRVERHAAAVEVQERQEGEVLGDLVVVLVEPDKRFSEFVLLHYILQ